MWFRSMFSPLKSRLKRASNRPKGPRASRRRQSACLQIEALEDRALPSAAFVFQWNDLLLDVQRVRSQGNQFSARARAMMNGAIYDSVNAIQPTHTVYHVDARSLPDVASASPDAAAAQAAYEVAAGLYKKPDEVVRINALHDAELAEVPDGPAKTTGVALGHYVAMQMLDWRANDGSSATVPYTVGTGPGVWQPTPPAYAPTPVTPQWPYVTPFALTSGDQFRSGPPPALTSADYTEAYQEVKALGGNGTTTPSTRTPEQTEIALFWAGLGVSNAGVAIWGQIAETVATAHNLSLPDNARLYAQMSVANADAFIAGFDVKYTYNFWRPVTAIRAGDTDGNPDTAADANWTPLIPTPNHPSYMSFHADHSRAAAEAIASFFGTDHIAFTATWAGVKRSFDKLTDAAKEAGMSRIYAGIHWSFDVAAGEQLGRKIAGYVTDHYFLPLTNSGGDETAPLQTRQHAEHGPASIGGLLAPSVLGSSTHASATSGNTPTADREATTRTIPAVEKASRIDLSTPALSDSITRIARRSHDAVKADPVEDELYVSLWAQV